MSILAVPSQLSLEKGFLEVLEEADAGKVTRIPVLASTVILVISMPKEHGQGNMYECVVEGRHGWLTELAWIPKTQPAFYRLKQNSQLDPSGPRTYLLRHQVVLLLSILTDTRFPFPVASIYLPTGIKASCPMHLLQVQLPTVFTAIATQPKINILRLSISSAKETTAFSAKNINARGSLVHPGDVMSTFLISPEDDCAVPFLWVIERSAWSKDPAQKSEDATAMRADTPSTSDSDSADTEPGAIASDAIYHVALYGRGRVPLLANSRITLTNLAPSILQQANAALRLRSNPGRPQSFKLPFREVFWPFQVTETEECDKEEAGEEALGGASNVCGVWDSSVGPLHTVRVTAIQTTRFSHKGGNAAGCDSDSDESPTAHTAKPKHSPPLSRASSATGMLKDTSSTPFTTADSDLSLSTVSRNSSLLSRKRKPQWLRIVTDGLQDQYCMRRYTQTISLAPLKLSLRIPPQPPIQVPEAEAALASLLDLEVGYETGAEQPTRAPDSGPVKPLEPTPRALKSEPPLLELRTPDSRCIPSFILGDVPEPADEGGETSPSSSLSSGSVGGSQKYYVTANTAWDVNAKEEEENKNADDISWFLSQPQAYSVARKRRLSDLTAARDTKAEHHYTPKARASGSTLVTSNICLIALNLVLIALVSVGIIALMLALYSPLRNATRWGKACSTS